MKSVAKNQQDLRDVIKAVPHIQQFIGNALCQSARKSLVMDFKYKTLVQKDGSTKLTIQVVIQQSEEEKEASE